jgi:metal-dependent hydrolase (beta-lactamase superfamily II)
MLAEWGLSILVETDDIKVLLDTGASISVPHNAPIFGKDISEFHFPKRILKLLVPLLP